MTARAPIFLSYGHRDAADLALRLAADLEAAGYDVWLDRDRIRTGQPWGGDAIVRGLEGCRAVVAVLSPHSTRLADSSPDRVTSVCINELTYAKFTAKVPILPVLAVPCRVPFEINELHYTDLTDPAQYAVRLPRLLDDLAGALRGDPPRYRRWYQDLRPLDFGEYLAERRRDFVGRGWLMDRIDAWRGHRRERALLVTGEPGVGKTAMVAQLVHLNPGGQVLAYHCCQADNPDTTDPARFVRSLAFQLASQLDAYALRLEQRDLQQALDEDDPGAAFDAAVVAPLARLPAPGGGVHYLLIDALDEAVVRRPAGDNLVSLLAPRLGRLPAWLRLVATSRPDHDVLRPLGALRTEPLAADSADNRDDLDGYLEARLATPDLAERLAAARRGAGEVQRQLAAKAAGNFLYAQQVLQAVEHDVIGLDRLDELPPGLAGVYDAFFRRLFPDAAGYAPARQVLEAVLAAAEPLTGAQLAEATGLEPDYQLPHVLVRLASFLPRQRERYALFHRSLADWLVDPNGPFHASPRRGHRALAEVGWRELERGAGSMSAYALRHLPTHLDEAGDQARRQRLLEDVVYLVVSGDLHVQLGMTGPAKQRYEQAVQVSRARVEADPGNAEWQRDLSVSHERVGDVLRARGDLAGAEAAYQDALAIRRRLAEADPGNAEWQRDLAVSYYKLATLHEQAGAAEEAERCRRQCWVVFRQMR